MDEYIEKAALDYLSNLPKGRPVFMAVNFMKVHQANMAHPDYIGNSLSKSKYADSLAELDTRVGDIMDKVRQLGIRDNTLVILRPTMAPGRMSIPTPDTRHSAAPREPVQEGGARVPAIAWWPGKIKAGSRNYDIVGSLDFMATFANLAGVKLPANDREGKPILFGSIDMTAVLLGTGKSTRDPWFYFTESEFDSESGASWSIQGRFQPAR